MTKTPYDWIASHGSPEERRDIEDSIRVVQYATQMARDGKLSGAQLREVETQLITEMMNRLPTEAYVEMSKNGQWAQLERNAAHDGTRSAYDVKAQREGLLKHVLRDAWSEGWAGGHVDDETFNAVSQNLGVPDDLKMSINDKDETASIDTYILNTFGEADYRQYREDVKRSESPTASRDEGDELSDDDVKEFQTLGIIDAPEASETSEVSADQSDGDAAPAEEPRAF